MRKKVIKVILTASLLISLIFPINRYFYGTWNVFDEPERIQCFGRRYYKSERTINFHYNIFIGRHLLPSYPAYSLNLITGKRIYTIEPKGKFVPTVIFLYAGNGRYVSYSLSGGP